MQSCDPWRYHSTPEDLGIFSHVCVGGGLITFFLLPSPHKNFIRCKRCMWKIVGDLRGLVTLWLCVHIMTPGVTVHALSRKRGLWKIKKNGRHFSFFPPALVPHTYWMNNAISSWEQERCNIISLLSTIFVELRGQLWHDIMTKLFTHDLQELLLFGYIWNLS